MTTTLKYEVIIGTEGPVEPILLIDPLLEITTNMANLQSVSNRDKLGSNEMITASGIRCISAFTYHNHKRISGKRDMN